MFIDLKAVSNPVSYCKHYHLGQSDRTIIRKLKGLLASVRVSFIETCFCSSVKEPHALKGHCQTQIRLFLPLEKCTSSEILAFRAGQPINLQGGKLKKYIKGILSSC